VNISSLLRLLHLSHEHVVDRNVDQFDKVTNGAHDDETDADCLRNFQEFPSVRLSAAVHELHAIADKVLGDIGEFLEGIRY